jgi:hypothetical protein
MPVGYIGTEEAILLLAALRYPDRWKPESMSEKELQIWEGFSADNGHLFTGDFLRHEVDWSTHGTIHRWCDFSEALTDVRKALDAGLLTARFRHPDGQWDKIKSTSWATEVAREVLLTGLVDLEGVAPQRVILINKVEFDSVFFVKRLSQEPHTSIPAAKYSPPTSQGQITKATNHLAAAFASNQTMTRKMALALIVQAGFDVTPNAFRQKVWPEARQKAGLPRNAPSGVKKKSLSKSAS